MTYRIHLIFGVLLFVLFLITGQLMYYYFPDKLAIEQDYRLLMRSRHIYIVFSAMIHMLVGALVVGKENWRRWPQYAGSFFLFVGSGLLIAAFFVEVFEYREFSNISASGIQTTLAGTVGHLFGLSLKQND